MKKILLSCFVTFGICANAQFVQNFDASSTMPAGWSIITGGDPNSFIINVVGNQAHSPTNVAEIQYHSQAHNDYLVTPAIVVQAGVNDRLSYWVKSQDAGYLEDYAVKLSTGAATPGSAFSVILKESSKAPGVWTQYFMDLRPYIGSTVYLAFHATGQDQFRLLFDDIVSDGYPTTPPPCSSVTSPANGSTVSGGLTTINWATSVGATGYKLTMGTTSNGTNVYNNTVNSTTTTIPLPINSTIYSKVIPTNANGDAVDCTETSFSTNGNLAYCIPSVTNATGEKITNVSFANINNASTSTVGYEDFTSMIANVRRDSSYPTTVKISTYNSNITSVWIDYNQDGDFTNDERTVLSQNATATGTIVIPETALLGKTRMRVRMSTSLTNAPCGVTDNGQVEDYTVNIEEKLAVSDISKNNVSLYPNPFVDILNISDVKGVSSISVNDVSGRKVKSLAPTEALNLSDLKAGVYIINLKMEDGSVKTFKTIKK